MPRLTLEEIDEVLVKCAMISRMIRVENLTKRFGAIEAVKGVSFEVKQGDVFAFLGPNGAGKTTTIRMLTTMLAPTSGRAMLDGVDVSKNPDVARRAFGIVFQDPSLDNELTAYENLYLHAKLYRLPWPGARMRIEELLRLVELWERKDDFVKNFSGGMKRRLEIARGLLHQPKVLFMDEPTIGLDPQTRVKLWTYVRDQNAKHGLTVFFTTHHLEEAERFARTIAVIDHGQLVLQGTLEAVKRETNTTTLEEAFLAVTGHSIRQDEATALDNIRRVARDWKV